MPFMQIFTLSAVFSCPGAPRKCLRFVTRQLSLAFGCGVLCPSGSVLILELNAVFLPFYLPILALDPVAPNPRALISQSSGKALHFLSFVEKMIQQLHWKDLRMCSARPWFPPRTFPPSHHKA